MTPLRLLVRPAVWLTLAAGLFVIIPSRGWGQSTGDDQALEDFFQAVLREDTKTAQQILSTHTNLARVTANRYSGKLPLLVAASKGQLAVVDQLLKLGADVNAEGDTWNTGNHRLTALEVSIWYNQPAVCRRLLQAKPGLNHSSAFNGGALQMAFAHQHDEMAGWLLDQGANPFLVGGNPYQPTTAFAVSIQQGDGKLVPRMVTNLTSVATAYLRTNGTSLLRIAATRGQVEAVDALLQAGVAPQSDSGTEQPVMHALALAAAAAPAAPGAPRERLAQVRDSLRTAGANYDVFTVTGFGDLETARQLFHTNHQVASMRDAEGNTPLHWAVKANQPALTAFWLESGASPNATNSVGQTPVHLAAASGLATQLDLLLAAHPALDIRDTNGQTPLDAAMQARQTETIRRLMAARRGAIPKDRGFSTVLHEAAASGNIVVLAALTGSTNVDARNELGLTPFQVAIQKGQLGAAALLVDRGADVNAVDPAGNTALHQIAGQWTFAINGRPSASWLARRSQDPRQATYLRYLAAGGNEDGWPRPTLQAAGFLLACGANASLTNQAGQTPMQLLMDSETVAFEGERGELLKLFGVAGQDIDQRDADGNTALHRAIQAVGIDEMEVLAALIAGGANVNATNAAGQTPLHVAVSKIYSWAMDDSSSPVQALIRAKANVNAQDNDGRTPLHVLVAADTSFQEEATRALLAAGADPNLRDKQGRSPILAAMTGKWPWRGASECVPMLAAAGADLTVTDKQGRSVLHYLAAMSSRTQNPIFSARNFIAVLTNTPLDFNAKDNAGDTPLHVAARQGAVSVFEWLSGQGARLDITNAAGATPRFLALQNTNRFVRFRLPASEDIHEAARRGDAETLRRLLQAEPGLINLTNRTGDTPLRIAAKNHQTNAVDALISSGAQWDVISAAMLGRAEPLKLLVTRNRPAASSVAYGRSALHWAAESGSVPAVETLLAAGAKLDASDRAGLSALGAALRSNRTAVVTQLRARGGVENIFDCIMLDQPELAVALLQANPALAGKANAAALTPVMTAVACGRARVLAALLEQPLPPATPSGFTALHVAAACNRTNEAALLIRHGADVAALDYEGAQPLHYAAAQGAAELIALLLQHGVNPDVPVQGSEQRAGPLTLPAGTTALHLAVMGGQTSAIAVLLRGGANVNSTNAMGLTPLDIANYSGQPGLSFGLRSSRLAIPGTILRFSQAELGVAGLGPTPPMLSHRTQQAVLEQLKQAGGERSRPVSDRAHQPWSPNAVPDLGPR